MEPNIYSSAYDHGDSRFPGFPECRVGHFAGFLHVVVSCKNHRRIRNRLALLPQKYKTHSLVRLGKKCKKYKIKKDPRFWRVGRAG